MDIKTNRTEVEREVKTYTITLTEEEAELMILLTGSIEGSSADGKRSVKKFALDISSPDHSAYPARKLKCNPDDLRTKLTDPIWEYLNTERAK